MQGMDELERLSTRLPSQLLMQIKLLAVSQGKTFQKMLEELLRKGLKR